MSLIQKDFVSRVNLAFTASRAVADGNSGDAA